MAREGGVQVISVTRAEVCAVACAELFRDAGESWSAQWRPWWPSVPDWPG